MVGVGFSFSGFLLASEGEVRHSFLEWRVWPLGLGPRSEGWSSLLGRGWPSPLGVVVGLVRLCLDRPCWGWPFLLWEGFAIPSRGGGYPCLLGVLLLRVGIGLVFFGVGVGPSFLGV